MANTKTKTEKRWVVVVGKDAAGAPVYIGEPDGIRQGVSRVENATRFTQRGAMRVLNGWPTAKDDGSAFAMQVAAEGK